MPSQNYPGLYRKNGAWHRRFYERTLVNGKLENRRRSIKLATFKECPNLAAVLPHYHAAAGKAHQQNRRPTSAMTLSEFWRNAYWPWVQQTKKPSTMKGYRDLWARHFESEIGEIRLCDFRKRDAIGPLEVMAYEKKLAPSTVHQGRTLLGSMFKRACEKDLVEHNPVRDFQTPRRLEDGEKKKNPAYTAAECEQILGVLPGRGRVIAAILAYTGMRPQEMAGLEWSDYDGALLHIRRAVWLGKVVGVKTEESACAIPVIPQLAEILDTYRATTAGIGWLVCGDTGKPINLGNVARREVRPVLKRYGIKWKTWYGFRRGAATILSDDMNLTEDDVRAILRHAPGSLTAREHYIVRQDRKRETAMEKYSDHMAEVKGKLNRPTLVV